MLDQYAEGTEYADLRHFSWHLLNGMHRRATTPFLTGRRFTAAPAANLLAVLQVDRCIHLYVLDGLSQVGRIPVEEHHDANVIRLSPDGLWLTAAGYRKGQLSVWDVRSQKQVCTIQAEAKGDPQRSPCFSSDGMWLASGSGDSAAKVWDTSSGRLVKELPDHRSVVCQVCFSPDRAKLATATDRGTIRIWDTSTWTCDSEIQFPDAGRLYALAFDPAGRRLAAGGGDDRILLWDAATAEPLDTLELEGGLFALFFFSQRSVARSRRLGLLRARLGHGLGKEDWCVQRPHARRSALGIPSRRRTPFERVGRTHHAVESRIDRKRAPRTRAACPQRGSRHRCRTGGLTSWSLPTVTIAANTRGH